MMPTNRTIRVSLVGCGQIADAHLGELRKIPGVDIVATCDSYRDLAEQAAARFAVPAAFDSTDEMLRQVKPDVVHITTPPHTHKDLALTVLNAGAHVYVEKPFSTDVAEADLMLNAAAARGLQICVGHDQLFDPIWEDVRRRHAAGEFGEIVHIDSVFGYDLSGPFGALLSEDPQHWVHRLPGGLFQNNISHAVYRITDFMPDERPEVWAHWFSLGRYPFPTDLRVMLKGQQCTASVLFSSRARPVQKVARLYGTRANVEVNLDAQMLRVERSPSLRGPFVKLQLPYAQLKEARRAFRWNMRRFLKSDIQFFGGMKRLFELFYASILEGQTPPILPADIRRDTVIMDDIFHACRADAQRRAGGADAAATPVLTGGVVSR
jgi:predicted dehydrogenase